MNASLGDEPALQTDLPFVGEDRIAVVNSLGQVESFAGRVESIRGDVLTLRRAGRASIEMFRMSDVAEISFYKSADWDAGLRLQSKAEYKRALEYFDKALASEDRDWAWIELQATAAKDCIMAGERMAAVKRIAEIYAKDPETRHVSLLPLVWDSRLPTDEKVRATVTELNSESIILNLVAASALLHESVHQAEAESCLMKLRRGGHSKHLSELADAQMWRLYLLDSAKEHPLTLQWQDRVSQLPVGARSGPQYVVARLLAKQHDYYKAALAFLWMPLMSPTDPALSARSLAEGIDSLRMAGRHDEAAALSVELQQRFAGTSAAKTAAAAAALQETVP